MTTLILPIGEFDTSLVHDEFETMRAAIDRIDSDLVIAGPVSSEVEARQAISRLADRNPDLLILIALRGLSAQTMEAAGLSGGVPCLFWPVQGRFALPSSALAAGALLESNIPTELCYAPANHPVAMEKIRCMVSAAKAYSRLRRSRIGIIGGLFPNLVSCRYDTRKLTSRLGIEFLQIPYDEVRVSLQGLANPTSASKTWTEEIAQRFAVQTEDMKSLALGIQLHLALKQIAAEKKIDGFATECWSGFPRELGLNPCLGFLEDAYSLACEGDVTLCAALLIVRFLTGRYAYAGDLYDLDLDGNLTLVHCGGPASLSSDQREVVLTKSCLAAERGFETMTCRPGLASGPVTLLRLYGLECNQLHLALGELSGSETSPDLRVRIMLAGDRGTFLEHCFGNHYIVAPGDIRGELKLLCKWLGISLFES